MLAVSRCSMCEFNLYTPNADIFNCINMRRLNILSTISSTRTVVGIAYFVVFGAFLFFNINDHILKMSKNAVSGESVDKTNVTVPTYLRALLERIAIREGFSDGYKIISRPGSNVGDGFNSIMVSIVISGARNGKNTDDQLVLVCKTPTLSELRQTVAVMSFKQEIASYETLLPALVKFQLEKGISESDGFFAFPKCYGTHSDEEKLEFAIVLEDLRPLGFRLWNKYAPIDYQHVKLVFAELGKFHAISFAMRQQNPDVFAQFSTYESNIFKIMTGFPGFEAYHRKNYDRALETLHDDDQEAIRMFTHLRDNFYSKFRASVSASGAEPFAVLCHGDCWSNNMMFQYASADSLEPQRAVLIDWQFSQYCSPATDISYYLYSSTEQPLRTAHFDDILHDYHDSLAELLHRLGGNADAQFSFDDLLGQLRTFGIYGLLLAPTLIQVVTVKAEDLPDMENVSDRKEFDFMEKGKPAGYAQRVRDVIRDFVDRGFFGEEHLTLTDGDK